MPNVLALSVVIAVAIVQSASPVLPRTGDVARALTEQDIAAMTPLLPAEAKPWYLNGDSPLILPGGSTQYMQVYLQPTTATTAIRRGQVLTITRRISSGVPPTAWMARPLEKYAQVEVPGKSFEQIDGDEDINRPFRVEGDFEDGELVRIVKFLRTGPEVRTERNGNGFIRVLPLLLLRRESPTRVSITLRGQAGSGQSVVLEKQGQDWVPVAFGYWIA